MFYLGDFNLISQAFELKAKSPSFEIVESQEIENNLEEIALSLSPIIVEASSLKNDFFSDKSKKPLSKKELIEKTWKLIDSSDFLSPELKIREMTEGKNLFRQS